MHRIIAVDEERDIFPAYRGTPVGKLLQYHNLDAPFDEYANAELLIGMCMDNRKQLHIPENFAFIIRAGGANLRSSEFKVSFAIAVGRVKAIALIGHTQCGMVNVITKREAFVDGLIENAGWDREAAEQHFDSYAPLYEIGNAIDFVMGEATRLRNRYPALPLVAPLLYRVEDNRLYQLAGG